MMKFHKGMLPVLSLALALAACGDDNSTGPDVYSEPFVVNLWSDGLQFTTATASIASFPIFLIPGRQLSIEAEFAEENGSPITPLSGEFMEVLIDDESIATFTPSQPGAFTGTLRSLAPGTTGIVFRYMYGGVNSSGAKASFTSAKFQFISEGI